ncbi:MAG: hypothetical protein WBL25_11475 [Anaerolineales bacterium]
MKQESIHPPNSNTFSVSFQQKSAGLSLVITSSAALYFIVRVLPMRSAALTTGTLPAGYGSLVLITLALIIIAQIVLQTVLAIGAGSAETATAAEQIAALKARGNAYFVLVAGMVAAIASIFVETLTLFDTANLAILDLALAEIVLLASQLLYGRQ